MRVSDGEMHAALAAFLSGRTEWPTYRQFQRAGLRSLRDEVTRRGGAQLWAGKLGMPFGAHRPGYAPRWTDARVRDDLRRYLAGQDEWPARRQFEADGRKPLRDAVNRTGGPDRWAAEFGLTRRDRRAGIQRSWTPEIIETRLRELIGHGTTWPSRRKFDDAGLRSMLSSIYAHEGPAYWARRLGVRGRPDQTSTGTRFWTEERIREELTRFCAGRDTWPTEREFIAANRRRLYAAASRNGGIARWAAQLGLQRAAHRRP